MLKKYLNNERGYTLLIALLAISVIMAIGLSILATTGTTKNTVERENKDQSAYYIAEAGLNFKKAELAKVETIFRSFQTQYLANENPEQMTSTEFINRFKVYAAQELSTASQKTNYVSTNSQCQNGMHCNKIYELKDAYSIVNTDVQMTDTQFTYTITSTGYVAQQKRKVRTTLNYALDAKAYIQELNSFSKYAIHSTNSLSMSNGSIVGNIGFSTAQPISNTFPFTSNSGSVSYTGGTTNTKYSACGWWKKDAPNECGDTTYKTIATAATNKDVTFNDSKLPTIPDFPFTQFPDLSKTVEQRKVWNGVIPSDAKISLPTSGALSGNYNLADNSISNKAILDIGSNTVNIYMKKFEISNPSIQIKGTGKINFYTDTFKQLSSGSIDFTNNDVTIFANDKVEHTGSTFIKNAKNLSIYTKALEFSASAEYQIQQQVKMYVHHSLELSNSFTMKAANWDVYYTGLSLPTFNGGFKNSINIDTLYSGLTISQGIHLGGNIIVRAETPKIGTKPTPDVIISGGSETLAPQYFYAPYSDIELSGSGTVVGSLIGKNITMSGNSNITFKAPTNTGGSSGSPGTTITTGKGVIQSNFSNSSNNTSIEIN